MTTHDLVIRGGCVVDGTGAASRTADIAIDGDRITAIGSVPGKGREEIDAQGLLVTPGFVDVHTHYDGQVTWENRLSPSSGHGVTTVVMGNCGVGFAPVRAGDQPLLVKLLEGVEDIPEVVMTAGVPFNWETFPEYLDVLAGRVSDIDFAAQLPHSALRVYVMGERGVNLEPPNDRDLADMRRLTSEAVRAGAIGVSTSRNLAHRFRDGRLAPSVSSEEQELQALAAGLRDAATGVFQLLPNSEVPAEEEFALMRRLAQTSGRPLSFSLLQLPTDPTGFDRYADGIAQAWADGLEIRGQFYPRPVGILMGLDLSYHPFSLNPSFRDIAHLPLADKLARMRDPTFRQRLMAEEPDDPNPFFVNVVKRSELLFPLGDPPNYGARAEDSIAARARSSGIPARELLYDALLEDDGHAIIYAPSVAPEAAVNRAMKMLKKPGTLLGLGDGGAHYGMICDAAYTTYLLTAWLSAGGVTLERAVQSLSQDPAQAVGLLDRGVLRPGFKADVNVIDVEWLHLHAPRIQHDLPADGKRLAQAADGYRATIVSGQLTYWNGEATGALPGRLIRGAQPLPA